MADVSAQQIMHVTVNARAELKKANSMRRGTVFDKIPLVRKETTPTKKRDFPFSPDKSHQALKEQYKAAANENNENTSAAGNVCPRVMGNVFDKIPVVSKEDSMVEREVPVKSAAGLGALKNVFDTIPVVSKEDSVVEREMPVKPAAGLGALKNMFDKIPVASKEDSVVEREVPVKPAASLSALKERYLDSTLAPFAQPSVGAHERRTSFGSVLGRFPHPDVEEEASESAGPRAGGLKAHTRARSVTMPATTDRGEQTASVRRASVWKPSLQAIQVVREEARFVAGPPVVSAVQSHFEAQELVLEQREVFTQHVYEEDTLTLTVVKSADSPAGQIIEY